MNMIELISRDTPDIIVDGDRYIRVYDIAEELFADNVMIENEIQENNKYKGHWITLRDEIYIDYEAYKLIMLNLVDFYKIFLEVVGGSIEDIFKRKVTHGRS